jgi:hypothetical protein
LVKKNKKSHFLKLKETPPPPPPVFTIYVHLMIVSRRE